jgi:hypothetical protein
MPGASCVPDAAAAAAASALQESNTFADTVQLSILTQVPSIAASLLPSEALMRAHQQRSAASAKDNHVHRTLHSALSASSVTLAAVHINRSCMLQPMCYNASQTHLRLQLSQPPAHGPSCGSVPGWK